MNNTVKPHHNKNFMALFNTQFLGALNDNIFKTALIVIITYHNVVLFGLDYKYLNALAGGIFILPFLLFSPISGQLCAKFEKSLIARYVKYAEVLIMCIAGYGFYTHNFIVLLVALFLMGTHSTFFGPIKYSILPDLLPASQLTVGNAYVMVGTFLAILLGNVLGGISASVEHAETATVIVILAVAILGVAASLYIPKVKIVDPNLELNLSPFGQIIDTIKIATKIPSVFNSVLGISWFWFFGGGFLSILPVLTKDILSVGELVTTLFLSLFTAGVALGSTIASKLSHEEAEIGFVPWTALGLSLALVDLAFMANDWPTEKYSHLLSIKEFVVQPGAWRIMFDLVMISAFGGAFTVPLYTFIQQRSDKKELPQVVAANNILNSIFMVSSAVMLMALYARDFIVPEIILVFAALNLVISFYIYTIVPEFTLRFLSWMLARMIYRIRVHGTENIPRAGAAVIICNHVTYVDWLVLSAAIRRPVRYVMYYKFFDLPVVRYLFRHAKVIPIAGVQEDKKIFDSAFETVSRELKEQELVCIFPEGFITRDGKLLPFRRGIEFILKRDPVPVIPIAMDGLWGSIFSRDAGTSMFRSPLRFWRRVDITIGPAIAAEKATAAHLESVVLKMLEDLRKQ